MIMHVQSANSSNEIFQIIFPTISCHLVKKKKKKKIYNIGRNFKITRYFYILFSLLSLQHLLAYIITLISTYIPKLPVPKRHYKIERGPRIIILSKQTKFRPRQKVNPTPPIR